MNNTLFVCVCEDISHQIIVSFDDDSNFNDIIYLQIHLSDVGLWQRLKYAILYILGKKSRYNDGSFGDILLNKKKTATLIETLQKHYEKMN